MSSFLKRPFSPYTLQFHDQNLESAYEKTRKEIQSSVFSWVSRLGLFLITIMGAYRLIFIQSRRITPEIVRSVISSTLLLLSIVMKKKLKNVNITPIFFGALYLTIMICEMESTREVMKIESWGAGYSFGNSFQFASLQLMVSIFHLHWIENWMLLTILQVYCLARFNTLNDEIYKDLPHQITLCIGITIFVCILSYAQERYYKWIYHQHVKDKKDLQYFHDLIKVNIPNPIIIAKKRGLEDDSIIFANTASEELLGTQNTNCMMERLNNFSFRLINQHQEKHGRCDSEKEGLFKEDLHFWNILREKSLTNRSDIDFRVYEATLETKKSTDLLDPLSQVKLSNSKTIVDGSFKLKSTVNIPRFSRILHSHKGLDKILEHQLSSESSSSSNEDTIIASPLQKKKQNKQNKKGTRVFSVKVGLINWEGDTHATLLIFNEVTDSIISANYKAEQTLARNKDRLLASVSHQMRTPLNAIISSIDSVLPKLESDKAIKKQIKLCWRSAHLLYYSIGNIIDLSKMNSKSFIPEISTVSGTALINEVINLVKFKAKLKKLSLECNYDHLKTYSLVCDPERLKQILLNLLDNSIKYTDPGGRIKFTVIVEAIQRSKSSVSPKNANSGEIHCEEGGVKGLLSDSFRNFNARFILEDSGVGIEGYKLPRLFKLFSEINGKNSPLSEGVGLGLALSQQLLKKMLPRAILKEGLIKVQSNRGKGSIFSFLVPVEVLRICRKTHSGLVRTPRASSISHTKLQSLQFNFESEVSKRTFENQEKIKSLRVLIVDDDQINQLVVKNYLVKLGVFNTFMADNGKEAVELVWKMASAGSPFDLVLMDCNMPIMNGYEATKKIREHQIASLIPPLKIIAITANVASNDWDRCREVGMNSYMTKPINKALFRQTLERHLELKFLDAV